MRPIEAGCSPSGKILQSKLESRERSGVGECTSLALFANYQFCGAPGWNRTNDPQLRRLMLYPTELRARIDFMCVCDEYCTHSRYVFPACSPTYLCPS